MSVKWGPSGKFIWLSTGQRVTCGIHEDGTVECWLWNSYEAGPKTSPDGTFIQIAASAVAGTCGIHVDGTAECWGGSGANQTQAPGGTFIHVAAGWDHYCGVREDGTVECWGGNDNGQSAAPAGLVVAMPPQ
jgi:alpha-tubulin suppressor-like RCC1 family protein